MRTWNGENNLRLFRQSLPVSPAQIAQAFYALHKEQISVKKEKVATERLAVIVDATFKLAHKKGFALMSLRDLSAETSISLGGLYAYIGSKQQLALMLHQFLPQIFNRCLLQDLDKAQSGKRQLLALIRGHLFLSECLQPWFFFAYMEAKYLEPSVKVVALDNAARTEKLLADLLSQASAEGELVIENRFLATLTLKGLLQSWYLKRQKFNNNKVSCENYADYIERLLIKGL